MTRWSAFCQPPNSYTTSWDSTKTGRYRFHTSEWRCRNDARTVRRLGPGTAIEIRLGEQARIRRPWFGSWRKVGDVETELKEIRDKYAVDEQHSVGIGDGWAKLSCDLGEHREGQTLRSVEARANAIGAHGADSQFRWLMFNGFVHLAPRAIQHGWSAPPGLTAAAFATPYGLHMPIQDLALTISMVASTFEDDLPDEVVPLAQRATMRQVGAERVEAFSRLLTTVGTVAAEFR